ncbi:neurexin-1-like isoform X2 [Acanthaster planci]|uniref:Neurexin-1-like isoform X2 n=1 Tax=Acanthaster planci TaxID=133434 RepID=A0A8B7ZK61_ACAPL|nr:neurexin-1-like isoform X2 [Acanthaster planci]
MGHYFIYGRLLLSCLCLVAYTGLTGALYYEGTVDTYTQYERWNTSVNGTLRFQFKSRQSNVLLAYADDMKRVDFMEIAMEDGNLLLHMRINNKARTLIVGDNLDDGEWHTVEVIRNNPRKFTFKVDGDERSGSMDGEIIELPTQTDFFFGGIPRQVRRSHLAKPEARARTHLKGHIRNIAYLVQARPNRWRRPEQLASNNVQEDFSDLCSTNDPCKNGGLCVSEDTQSRCECDGTGFVGEICEEEFTPAPQSQSDEVPEEREETAITATFDGTSYISYSLALEEINTLQDDVIFDFRTQHPNGLLLYVGHESDFIYVALVNGLLEVAINLGSGEYRHSIQPRREMDVFTDNNWHKVRISRTRGDVRVRVDGSLLASGSAGGNFGRLTVGNEFYVGGSPNPATLSGSRVGENFRGNLRDVSYYGNIEMELLEKASRSDPLIYIQGDIIFREETVQGIDPITFLTEESLLRLPRWNAESKGSLSFDFRTNEPNAVIMYSSGSDEMSDFLAFELLEGYLYVILDLGSGPVREKAYTFPLNDGEWHHVVFERDLAIGIINVGSSTSHKFEVPGHNDKLNLEMDLIVGGIEPSLALPLELFSGALRQGYVGCIRNMAMNGETLDLPQYVEEQSEDGNIVRFCREEDPLCTSDPCQHGGSCREGWNRFICDCRKTGYSGETCKDEVARLAFNGNQSMRITLRETTRSKVEEIFLRFRTSHPDGMLIATTSDTIIDILLAELSHGEVRVTANFGTGSTTITAGTNLDDNQWHSFSIERHDRTLRLTVDDSDKAEAYNVSSRAGDDFESGTLDFRYIDVGSLLSRPHLTSSIDRPPNFQGHMEQFIYNNHHYFDLAREEMPDFIENTASFGEQMSRRPIHDPFTFHTPEVLVQLPQIKTYPSLSIFFQFKTTVADGLIFYTEGELDFLAIELVDGFIYYTFNLGGGAKTLRGNSRERLNDNRWHEVGISHDSRDRQVLKVDSRSARSRSTMDANHFDFTENLFVGGKETFEFLPEKVQATQGYQGCLASLEINGRHEDLMETAVSMELKEELTRGCEDKRELCIDHLCNFGGICVPGFDTYTCDCRRTSFTGQYCSNVSIGYQFGESGGLISLELPKDQWLRSDRDSLSLGFVAESQDGILTHISSANSHDYIEMKLLHGHLFVRYNFGAEDHVIGEKTYRVNDGRYHTVQFTRRGENSTLQVDFYPKVELFQNYGRKGGASYFDAQSKINIGATSSPFRRKRRAIMYPFQGVVAGLAYNDLRILDMAASGDERITFDGDVSLASPYAIWEYVTEPFPTVSLTTANVTDKPAEPGVPEPEPSPHVSGNKTLTGPTKMIMSTATTDGDIDFGTDPDNIFVTQSGCGSVDDEDCQIASGDGAIFTPVDEMESTSAPSETTPSPSTAVPITTTPSPKTSLMDSTAAAGYSGSLCDILGNPGCLSGDATPSPAPDFNFTTFKSSPAATPPPVPPKTTRRAVPPTHKPTIGSVQPEEATGDGLGFLGQTWLVIGLVAAGALIFLLLVIILYKFRNRNEGSYHINESRNYSVSDATRTALLPSQQAAQQPNTNGTLPTKPIKPKLPPEYATKEWYV